MRPIPVSRMVLAALAAGSMLMAASGAIASDRSGGHDRDFSSSDWRSSGKHARNDRHEHRHQRKNRSFKGQPLYGDGPLPDRVPGLGTFSGGISAERDRGNGIYFSLSGGNSGPRVLMAPKPAKGPKIIAVTPDGKGSHCDNAGAVCIIRP